jgi:tRNA(Ile)-lysidine synthase
MLLLLHALHERREVRLEAVAHLNHSIRPEAAADEAFCRELAGRCDLPFVSATADVPAQAHESRRSLEVAGRLLRRQFLDDVRRARGAEVIATAHTQDDQAETVLLRLLRGAGGKGLGAIAPIRGPYVRPVLFAAREDLREWLRQRAQQWREDATNQDRANPRNRIRHELLPYLEQHFNPSVRRTLARMADLARADDAWIWREAVAASVGLLRCEGDEVRIDRRALNATPEAIARRVVIQALLLLQLPTAPALHHVEAVMDVAAGRRKAAAFSSWRVEPSSESVVLVRGGLPPPYADSPAGELRIPGEVMLMDGVGVSAEGPHPLDRYPGGVGSRIDGTEVATVDADEVGERLVVRTRRPGDRFRPLGMRGSRKLQDLFVDRKVRRDHRDKVPIVTDKEDRIVWVAGHAIGDEFRVTDRTKAVIILKLRRRAPWRAS